MGDKQCRSNITTQRCPLSRLYLPLFSAFLHRIQSLSIDLSPMTLTPSRECQVRWEENLPSVYHPPRPVLKNTSTRIHHPAAPPPRTALFTTKILKPIRRRVVRLSRLPGPPAPHCYRKIIFRGPTVLIFSTLGLYS